MSAARTLGRLGGLGLGLGLGARALRRRAAGRRGGGPLRSVVIAHPSPDLYGSDRVMLESVSAFTSAGVRVTVVLPGHGPLVDLLVERGAAVEYATMGVLRKSAMNPAGLVGLAKGQLAGIGPALDLFRRTSADLLLVNTVTIPGWLAHGRMAGLPVVCHVHEAEASQSSLVKKVLYAPLLLADGLVVNSRFALGVLTDVWPVLGGRARIVYNGVVGPEAPEPPRADPKPLKLLFLGRLSPRKGPQVAIDAMRELADLDVTLSLLGAVFPGYEWFEDELRQAAATLPDGKVTFLGFRPDIWDVVADHDVVLVPSTVDEPFGNTAVEAMLAERPLVVSETSGLREAARDYATARFVPAGDAGALAAAVRGLHDDWEQVRHQSPADRDEALRRHAPETYADSLRTACAELVGRSA